MAAVLTPQVRIFPDLEALSRAAASGVAAALRSSMEARGSCLVALAGGRTPRRLYEALAESHGADVRWERVHIFWGDERYVPPDDPQSNYRLAREVLLDRVPIPAANVHRMPTELPSPASAARAYEALLRRHLGPRPRFDLVLLGLGADGHVASVFPGSPAVAEERRWVMAVEAPAAPRRRLTLTLPTINRAARVFVVVAGPQKAAALARALMGPVDPWRHPASAVRPVDGSLVWWTDEAAAARLPGRHRPQRTSADSAARRRAP